MAVYLSLLAGAGWQFFDNNGAPLSGGLLYTYGAGTTTPAVTYTSNSGVTANSNPIVLDAAGRIPEEVWLSQSTSYKFVLKTSTFVQIWEKDNISGANDFTNIYADFANCTDQAKGDALVAFRQAYNGSLLTGAVCSTVHTKLSEYLSVFDFMTAAQIADVQANTASLNVSAAIQAAVDAAKGRTIWLPAGTYLITTPIQLNWSTSTADIYQAATRIVGDNYKNTIILNRSGDYALIHKPTIAQTQTAVGIRMVDGELAHFQITTDAGSPSNSSGIKLASYFNANIHDISISSALVHGIYIFLDEANYGTNPDKYSCGTLLLKNSLINGCAGWAVRAEMYSITWEIANCTISNNTGGGIYTCGAGHRIVNNAIVGCGNSGQTSVGGVWFAHGASQGAPENIYFTDNEMQENWGSHIYHEGYNSWFIQNRFLQDATAGTGGNTFRNNFCIYFDASSTGACFDNTVRDNLYRFDSVTGSTPTTIYGNYVSDDAGAYNNLWFNNNYSPNAFAATINKYHFPVSSPALNHARNYAVEQGIQVAGGPSTAYSFGQIVTTINGATRSVNATPGVINLVGQYNPNIANTFSFSDTTHAFTVPYGGLLRIAFNGVFAPQSGGVGVPASIYVYKNGSAYHTQSIPQGFAIIYVEQNYAFEVTFTVNAGDSIQLYASISAGNLYALSNSTSTTTFQML